jgi:hypothetical protein
MAELIVRGSGHLKRPCFCFVVADWRDHQALARDEPDDAARHRAGVMAVCRDILEQLGIDPDDPFPAVKDLPEGRAFLVAEYLLTHRELEDALAHGADKETLMAIAREIETILQRIAWLAVTDPDLGKTLEQLAQVGRNAIPGRRKGALVNRERAAALAGMIARLAWPIRERSPGISNARLAHLLHAKWPATSGSRPSEHTIRRYLGG